MNIVDIISKKRDGGALTKEEIEYFVTGYTDGTLPDYQASALLMAIFFNKLNKDETYYLTAAMKNSGECIDLSAIEGIKVDKHSTGGVGDKTTLIVGPLASACGVPIAKMSGRGLGFTGGTVDKMESIPGFETTMTGEDFIKLVNEKGLSVIGQTAHIAPADKKIYALRDVTGTVENMGLIASSVMSKKLASGSDAIVLDVKCGNGAFMESLEDAVELAELMVEIGNADGKDTMAVVTDMSQPLGYAIGNSNEVIEAIETLKGRGPQDITELSLELSSHMIVLGGMAKTPEEGYAMAKKALESGEALSKLKGFIEGQGGDVRVIQDYSLFAQPEFKEEIIFTENMLKASGLKSGEKLYVSGVNAKAIGLASQHSGAGRAKKGDEIDLSAGIMLNKKVGDTIRVGEVLATVYGNKNTAVKNARAEIETAFTCSNLKPEPINLILKVLKKS